MRQYCNSNYGDVLLVTQREGSVTKVFDAGWNWYVVRRSALVCGRLWGGGKLLEGLEDLRWKLYRVTWDPLQPPIKPGSIKRQMAVGIIGKPRKQSTKPGLIMDYNNLPWGQPAGLHLKKGFKSRNGSVSFWDICFEITVCEPIAFH